ncbi:T5orf172 domain protein [Bacillus cereus]|nr:T5orf172 domain protein [Bacillus cereus]
MDQQNLNTLLQLHQCKTYHAKQLHDIENKIKSLVMEMQLQSYEQEIREIMKQYLMQAIEILECIGNPENDLIKEHLLLQEQEKERRKNTSEDDIFLTWSLYRPESQYKKQIIPKLEQLETILGNYETCFYNHRIFLTKEIYKHLITLGNYIKRWIQPSQTLLCDSESWVAGLNILKSLLELTIKISFTIDDSIFDTFSTYKELKDRRCVGRKEERKKVKKDIQTLEFLSNFKGIIVQRVFPGKRFFHHRGFNQFITLEFLDWIESQRRYNYFYVCGDSNTNLLKIGVTSNMEKRFSQLKNQVSYSAPNFRKLLVIRHSYSFALEAYIKDKFQNQVAFGTEWIHPREEDIHYLLEEGYKDDDIFMALLQFDEWELIEKNAWNQNSI